MIESWYIQNQICIDMYAFGLPRPVWKYEKLVSVWVFVYIVHFITTCIKTLLEMIMLESEKCCLQRQKS